MQSPAQLEDLSLIKPLGTVNLHQSKCSLSPRALFAGFDVQHLFPNAKLRTLGHAGEMFLIGGTSRAEMTDVCELSQDIRETGLVATARPIMEVCTQFFCLCFLFSVPAKETHATPPDTR